MEVFFTTTLGVSIIGMVSLLAVKRYELNSGRVVLNAVRPHLNTVFHRTLVFVERILPVLVRVYAERMVLLGVRAVQQLIARTILIAEHWLQKALDTLRMTTHVPHPSIPASAFLREVAEHKKTIIKRSRRPRGLVAHE